jgi:hypothetical protein
MKGTCVRDYSLSRTFKSVNAFYGFPPIFLLLGTQRQAIGLFPGVPNAQTYQV